MGTYYSFPPNFGQTDRRIKLHEAAAAGLIEELKANSNLTDQDFAVARAKLNMLGHDRDTAEAVQDYEMHHRERFDIMEVHRDGDEIIKVGARPVGGGRFEKVEFREERVTDRSILLKEVR